MTDKRNNFRTAPRLPRPLPVVSPKKSGGEKDRRTARDAICLSEETKEKKKKELQRPVIIFHRDTDSSSGRPAEFTSSRVSEKLNRHLIPRKNGFKDESNVQLNEPMEILVIKNISLARRRSCRTQEAILRVTRDIAAELR